MRVLFFVPPWAMQGDLFFSYNAFKNHLLPQAHTLSQRGVEVIFAIGEGYVTGGLEYPPNTKIITIDQLEALAYIRGFTDPSPELYKNSKESDLTQVLAKWLRPQLPEQVDVVMLWEAPVPYLRHIYPQALIVHQMPGAFSREPYPHTVVFDSKGLYRDSVFYTCFDDFSNKNYSYSSATSSFVDTSKNIFSEFEIFTKEELLSGKDFQKLTLLPLQISQHYSFKVDTEFFNQRDLILEVLKNTDSNTGVVITQYISRLYTEKPLDEDFRRFLDDKYKNIIYDQRFEEIPTISQYILPQCDSVITASSSLGLQALIWDKPISVFGDTHLKPLNNSCGKMNYNSKSVLSFMIGQQQPLANRVINDGSFLVPLLEEMLYRNGHQTSECLPSFDTIDPDYFSKLIDSFRTNNTRKLLTRKKLIRNERSKTDQFRTFVQGNEVNLISFDIFDTLITRRLEQPADAYKLLEQAVVRYKLADSYSITEKRLEAELRAREVTEEDEITLEDIYIQLRKLTGWTKELSSNIMQAELDLEVSLAHQRPIGRKLWEIARQTGKPIVLLSDMYLPQEVIERILEKTGYTSYNKLFLSSTVRKTKKEGSLFDHLIEQTREKPENIIHVGDNPRTDLEPALARNLIPFHVPRPTIYLHEHKQLGRAFPKRRKAIEPLSRSMFAGLIANKLFDDPYRVDKDSIFSGDLYNLGYCGLGPVIVGYMSWLAKTANRQNIKRLYFLSREGRILKEIFEIVSGDMSDIQNTYLFGSRRAIRLASVTSKADIIDMCQQPIAKGATLADILDSRFSIDKNSVSRTLLEKNDLYSVDQLLGGGATAIRKVIGIVSELHDEILEIAKRERVNYLSYLASEEFGCSDDYGIVDIGWNANMQGALGKLLNKTFHGFYYSTLHGASRWSDSGHKIFSYHLRNCVLPDGSSLVSNRLLFEYLTCEGKGSVIRIERDKIGQFRPIRNESNEPPLRRSLTQHVHKGITDFANDIVKIAPELISSLDFDPHFCERVMDEFLRSPKPKDAEMLAGHYLEDSFGGLKKGYFITPKEQPIVDDNIQIYWKNGQNVVHDKKVKQHSRHNNYVKLFRNGCKAYHQSDFKNAVENYQKAMKLEPNNPHLKRVIAEALIQLHREKEAIEHLKEAHKLIPKNKAIKRRLTYLINPLIGVFSGNKPFPVPAEH